MKNEGQKALGADAAADVNDTGSSPTETASEPKYPMDRVKMGALLLEGEAAIMMARAAMLRGRDQEMIERLLLVRSQLSEALSAFVHPGTSDYFIAVEAPAPDGIRRPEERR